MERITTVMAVSTVMLMAMAMLILAVGEPIVMIAILWCSPTVPSELLVEDWGLTAPLQQGHRRSVFLKPIEVFEEQQPGGLLGVVELGAAASFFAEAVVDGAESLLERAGRFPMAATSRPCSLGWRLRIRWSCGCGTLTG